jgi:hypothetical protein
MKAENFNYRSEPALLWHFSPWKNNDRFTFMARKKGGVSPLVMQGEIKRMRANLW